MTTNQNIKRCWYLVTTKPKSEFKAQENLLRQGYETYLPLIQTSRRRNSQMINRTEPFFPRYLFIHLNKESDNWSPIRSTIGVSGLVRFGGLPAAVPENMITNLKNNENESGLQVYAKKVLKQGDKVDVIAGPFEGYTAIYQKMKNTERVSVLLDIVGKTLK